MVVVVVVEGAVDLPQLLLIWSSCWRRFSFFWAWPTVWACPPSGGVDGALTLDARLGTLTRDLPGGWEALAADALGLLDGLQLIGGFVDGVVKLANLFRLRDDLRGRLLDWDDCGGSGLFLLFGGLGDRLRLCQWSLRGWRLRPSVRPSRRLVDLLLATDDLPDGPETLCLGAPLSIDLPRGSITDGFLTGSALMVSLLGVATLALGSGLSTF